MAEAARLRPAAGPAGPAWLSRPLLPDLQRVLAREIDWEVAGYALLVALSFVVRIWDVGGRAMHHDESLHATYAWYLFKGRGYQYNPLMHGPLQFYVMAFFYMLFGDSETTARLFAVLSGSAIVFLPYFLRREMGRNAAAIAALALAISPTFLYFSRFARDDIYLDFFTLVIVVAAWSYVRKRRARSLYVLSVAMALAMATMEVAYIVFFIFGSFVLLLVVRELFQSRFAKRSAAMSAGRDAPSDNRVTPAVQDNPPMLLPALRSISLDTALYAFAIFFAITVLLYSTFFTNPYGVIDPRYGLLSASRQDILGGITYWLSQHGVARGGQPWFYYLLLFPLYEQFALVFAATGVVWAFVRRDLFVTFLAFWFVMSLAIFSWAGEKMPWLFLHPLLPAILLASTFMGHLLGQFRRSGRIALISCLLVLLIAEAHSAQALTYADGANPTEMLIYVQTSNDVPYVAAEAIGLVHRIKSSTLGPLIQVDDADLQGWPFEWYFRNLPAKDVSYSSNFAGKSAPILLMLGPEHDQYGASLVKRYVVSQYRWNWWFPEDYKGLAFDNGKCGTAAHETTCPPGQPGTVFLRTGTPCPSTDIS
ncbi:MAG TPA: flippase activity-associated protein Agl23, partial [Chloroflexota bacterium]|nr:flippase activity-associated protein Agl23 [Chloroflexota bacterium]